MNVAYHVTGIVGTVLRTQPGQFWCGKKNLQKIPAKPVKGTVGVKDPWERILHHSPIAEGMSLTSLPFAVSRITTCSRKSCWDIARQFSEAMMEGKEGLVDSRLA